MAHHQAPGRYCPGCGGPNPDPRAAACRFCEGPLVPVGTPDPRHTMRCPSCATAVAEGASFCGQCGHALAQTQRDASPHTCPGCSRSPMEAFGLAPSAQLPQGSPVHGCRGCGGVWIETAVLDRLLAAAAAHAIPDGRPVRPSQVKGRTMASTKVVYRRCAVCNDHMQRRNFARVSGIIVDQCRHHGTFFDAGELEDVVAFVRSGGLRLAAEREAQEREREARHRVSMAAPVSSMSMSSGVDPHWALESQRGVDPIGAFVRWGIRWITGR